MSTRRKLILAMGIAFTIAAVVGAYGDWVWWPVYSGLTITIAAVLILAAGIVLTVVRRARPVGLVVLAVAIGLLAGQNLGPSRPQLHQTAGTITVDLTAPKTTAADAPVSCSMDTAATELQISDDSGLRMDIFDDDPSAPTDVDQREFFKVLMTVGDRWIQGPTPRSDHIFVLMIVGRVEGGAPEVRMVSAPSSTLTMDWSPQGGSLSFAGLIQDSREPTGDPVDLAGTLSWTCDEPG